MRFLIALTLLAVTAGCSHDPLPASINDALVRSKAVECGIGPGQLKIEVGRDGKREWFIGTNREGTVPSFKSFQCFMDWGKQQRGVRIGFISEPPPPEAQR